MRLPVQKQVWWWGGVGLLIAFALWRLGTVMTPFLLGAGIAYILDPVADRLEATGLRRKWAVGLITLVAALAFVLVLLLILPTMIRQTLQGIEGAPAFLERLQDLIATRYPRLLPEGGALQNAINNGATAVSDNGAAVLGTVLTSLGNVLGVIALLVIVPVVAFYLLLDWDHMISRVDELLPREHAPSLRRIAHDIDDSLSGFLRGQGLVTLILGTFYAVGLFAVGLPFGLVIGVVAAILSIIPYVGVFIGGLTATAVALVHFWGEPFWIGAVMAIFGFGQFVEGNYLQPKIIGGHVGLHPVWLMIALSVFGTLFGFVGLIVAVPLAAMVGVVARFLAGRYKESALYTGREVPPMPPPPTLVELVPRGTVAETRRRAETAKAVAVAEVRIEGARREALRVAEESVKTNNISAATAEVAVITDPDAEPQPPVVLDVSPEPLPPRGPGAAAPVRTAIDDSTLSASQPERERRSAELAEARATEAQHREEIRQEMMGQLRQDDAHSLVDAPQRTDRPSAATSDPAAAAELLFEASGQPTEADGGEASATPATASGAARSGPPGAGTDEPRRS